MEQPVHIIGAPGQESTQTARVELWPKSTRLKNGAKILAIGWLLAGAAIFIPMLHFVLVPLFFVAGIIGALWRARQPGVFLPGDCRCPQCGAGLELGGTLFALPLYRECPGCSQKLFIEQADPA